MIGLSSSYGNKGFILTADMMFAIGVVITILLISSIYLISSRASKNVELSASRVGSDIVAIMDYNGALYTLNKNAIEAEIDSLLPDNLRMSMRIEQYSKDLELLDQIQIKDDIIDDYYSGKWSFIKFSGDEIANYYLIRYKIAFR